MRAVPGSTTYWMPGTVSEVSATLVASTMRRPLLCGWKTRCCSASESRAYSGRTSTDEPGGRGWANLSFSASAVSRISRSPERNTRMSPGASTRQLVDRVAGSPGSGRGRSCSGPRGLDRAVADLDRVGAAGDLDDRRGLAVGVGEVLGEPLGVDRRRGDDDLQVGPAGEQLLEVAEDEVDVQAALVRLVDDQRVVAAQRRGRAAARPAGCRRSSA